MCIRDSCVAPPVGHRPIQKTKGWDLRFISQRWKASPTAVTASVSAVAAAVLLLCAAVCCCWGVTLINGVCCVFRRCKFTVVIPVVPVVVNKTYIKRRSWKKNAGCFLRTHFSAACRRSFFLVLIDYTSTVDCSMIIIYSVAHSLKSSLWSQNRLQKSVEDWLIWTAV